jgi:hypothetical protein
MRLLENINYAKTLLKKKGLDTKNPDYQAILKLANKKLGWVGLLAKLHWEYDVDLTEIEHIFDTLIKHNVDLGKVFKMTYDELSDYLYELTEKVVDEKKGYKLVHFDGTYNYYLVSTFRGIEQTGSPAWCLKTESNWRQYVTTPSHRHQWVLYKKGFSPKNLIVPDTFYLSDYRNVKKQDIRIGITFDYESGEVTNAHDDNNNNVKNWVEETGILNTIRKLEGLPVLKFKSRNPELKLKGESGETYYAWKLTSADNKMLYYFGLTGGLQELKNKMQDGIFWLLASADELESDKEEKPEAYIFGYNHYQGYYKGFDGDLRNEPLRSLVDHEIKSTLPKMPNFIFLPMCVELGIKSATDMKEKNKNLNFDYDDKFVYWGFVTNDVLKFSVESVDCKMDKNVFFNYNVKTKKGSSYYNGDEYAFDTSKVKMIGAPPDKVKDKINQVFSTYAGKKEKIMEHKVNKIIERYKTFK